jgi:hypothetical protein
MAQAKRNEQPTEHESQPPQEQTTSFTNKPIALSDNGHGTKVKLWPNDGPGQSGIPNVSVERSFKRKDSEEWETQKVTLNASDLLTVARGLEKGHAAIVERNVAPRSQSRE